MNWRTLAKEYFDNLIMCFCGPRTCIYPFCKMRESTSTRATYCLLFVLAIIFALVLHDGSLFPHVYDKFTSFFDYICFIFQRQEKCMSPGYISVYRSLLPLAIMHLLLFLITMRTTSSHSITGEIHNGYWFLKFCFLLIFTMLLFVLQNLEIIVLPIKISTIFAGVAISLIQLIFLIDSSYEVNNRWHSQQRLNSCLYITCFCSLIVLFYVGSLVIYIFLLIRHVRNFHQCTFSVIAVLANLFLTICLLVISARSYRVKRNKIWLPGATVSIFVSVKTFLGLNEQPSVVDSNSVHFVVARSFWKFFSSNVTQSDLHLQGLNNVTWDQIDRWGFAPTRANFTQKFIENACISSNSFLASGHWANDLLSILGVLFVIGWLIYNTFKTTQQSERIGILPANSKIKIALDRCKEMMKDRAPNNAELLNIFYSTLKLPKAESFRRVRLRSSRPVVKSRAKEQARDCSDGRPQDQHEIYQALAELNEAIYSATPSDEKNYKEMSDLASSLPDLKVFERMHTDHSSLLDLNDSTLRVNSPVRRSKSTFKKNANRLSLPAKKKATRPTQVKFKESVSMRTMQGDSVARLPVAPRVGHNCLHKQQTEPLLPPPRATAVSVRRLPQLDRVQRRVRCYSSNYFNTMNFDQAREATELISQGLSLQDLIKSPKHADKAASLITLHNNDEALRQNTWLIFNEYVAIVYSYTWFHLVFCLSTLAIMGQLTNWFEPEKSALLSKSWMNVWMTLGSTWIALFLYACSLCLPSRLIKRYRRSSTRSLEVKRPSANPKHAKILEDNFV